MNSNMNDETFFLKDRFIWLKLCIVSCLKHDIYNLRYIHAVDGPMQSMTSVFRVKWSSHLLLIYYLAI